MRVTTKARLEVAAMVDVALQSRQVSIWCARVVSSSRGRGAGYSLARAPDAISAAHFVRALDDEPAPRDTSRAVGWPSSAGRLDVDSLWSDAAARMFEILQSTTLDILARQEEVVGDAIAPKTGGLGR